MALIDRALQKAFRRPSHAATPTEQELPAGARGWVPVLRPPRSADIQPVTAGPEPERRDAAIARALIPPAPKQTLPVPGWKWPEICQAIINSSARAGLERFAGQLQLRCRTYGSQVVLFSGPGTTAGRSSLILTLARLLCDHADSKVLAVDLNLARPALATLLGIAPHHGLMEVVSDACPLDDVIVPLVPERFSLLPLESAAERIANGTANSQRIGQLLRGCRSRFDLVLVDAGSWEATGQATAWGCEPRDTLVWVTRGADAQPVANQDHAPWPDTNLEVLGIMETFVPGTGPSARSAAVHSES